MTQDDSRSIAVGDARAAQMRHTLKASNLLYSAPSFALRGPTYLVFIIVLTSFIYSFVATKAEVVVAPLELQRKATTLQAIGGGMVVDILTEENAQIDAGDPIAVVQEQIRAITSPEQEALLSRRRELKKELDKAEKDYDHEIGQLELDLTDLDKTMSTELVALTARIDQIELQVKTARRANKRARERFALARKRLQTKTKLYQDRDITITEYEEAQESVAEIERLVDDTLAEVQQTNLALQTAKQERSKVDTLHRQEKLERDIEKIRKNKTRDVKDLRERIASIMKKIEEADTLVSYVEYDKNRKNLARYKSDYDGTVVDLAIKTGQLIEAGSPIATIVRATAPLEARILVENKDIGNLEYGQEVSIKYFAYPYQNYGIPRGTITEIATKPGSIDGEVPELRYLVTAALRKETISKRGEDEKQLEIGLAGIAEIKTGEKLLIELVFAPVSRFFDQPKAPKTTAPAPAPAQAQ